MKNQICTQPLITKDGKTVACMGYMEYQKNYTSSKDRNTVLKCPLCGFTKIVIKPAITPL